MSTFTYRNVFVYLIALFSASQIILTQGQPPVPVDPFQLRAPGIGLKDQSIVDGIAALSQSSDVAYSMEFPLGATISAASPPVKTVTATIEPGTIREVLDKLCVLDQTFTWTRIGNTANIVPRAMLDDPGYLLNRRLEILSFKDVSKAQDAVLEMVGQLPGPREQVAILQSGIPLSFVHPLTATFRNITVREVFDYVAQQFGPTYGWQFGGAADFRVITFHQRLAPKPKPSNPSAQ